MAALTESEVIDQIYSAYENDDTTWSSSDAEYLTARRLCKAAIMRWEYLEGMKWPELFVRLTDASDGTKTTTAGDYDYTCPTNMRLPPAVGDYVKIGGSYYEVVALDKVQQFQNSSFQYCYFTGSQKAGYTLNINPSLTLTTGAVIEYNYYKTATYFTATTSTTEMSNPFFIVHYVLARLFRNDGLLTESRDELQVAENLLQEMKSDATNVISDSVSGDLDGFGV